MTRSSFELDQIMCHARMCYKVRHFNRFYLSVFVMMKTNIRSESELYQSACHNKDNTMTHIIYCHIIFMLLKYITINTHLHSLTSLLKKLT